MDLDQAFADLADELTGTRRDVQTGRMFGAASLKTGGKVFAMLSKGRLVAKLPADQIARLVASGEGEPFVPGHGRTMREWVSLLPADRASLATLMEDARAFVAEGAARRRG